MDETIPSLATPAERVDLYAAVGGRAACLALATAFYAHVAQTPILRPLFPATTFTCAIEAFAAFLAQLLGGPPEHSQRRQWLSLRDSHRRFAIGPREREAWLLQMDKALDDVPMQDPVRHALRAFFARSSTYLVNRPPGVPDALVRSNPPEDEIGRALLWRWEVQRGLDAVAAAVHAGDATRALSLTQSTGLQSCLQRDHAVWVMLLALMIDSGHRELLDYVHATLRGEPALVHERAGGRMLLHGAAAAGCISTVQLLLQLGADPNGLDLGGHRPLYWVANACAESAGPQLVRLLATAGAQVDAAGGVTRCTALHMAARRGNAAVAAALLDCGADIEARDYRGNTALRRAVNRNQTAVTALLLARGADRQARGSQGLTPCLAARTDAMNQVLHSGDRD